jgi:hypothetical protein
MAHFAKINKETRIVETVIVATQAHINSLNDFEDWVQTSYNGNIRKNYAGIGYTYDKQRDAFIPPKPFASWTLNEETCQWVSPVAKPEYDGKMYVWNEEAQHWDEVTE